MRRERKLTGLRNDHVDTLEGSGRGGFVEWGIRLVDRMAKVSYEPANRGQD